MEEKSDVEKQIDDLANFIMHEVEGEPSQSEGAVECAIRLLRKAYCAKIKEVDPVVAVHIAVALNEKGDWSASGDSAIAKDESLNTVCSYVLDEGGSMLSSFWVAVTLPMPETLEVDADGTAPCGDLETKDIT